jgi:hypothetical protein
MMGVTVQDTGVDRDMSVTIKVCDTGRSQARSHMKQQITQVHYRGQTFINVVLPLILLLLLFYLNDNDR